MQLSPSIVNWNMVVALRDDGRLEEALWSEDQEANGIIVGEAPWPSDSFVQYSEVAEAYSAIKQHLNEKTRGAADVIMTNLILEDSGCLPKDLGTGTDLEGVIGSISPTRVAELVSVFAALDYRDLDNAFDNHLPEDLKDILQIPEYGPSEEVFSGYIRQWEDLLKCAKEHDGGILLHIG
jgi:hypothetical protein